MFICDNDVDNVAITTWKVFIKFLEIAITSNINIKFINFFHDDSPSIIIRAELSLLSHCRSLRYRYCQRRAALWVTRTCHKMTAKRGRAPVVTARATAEWRFGYRESEYNITVAECFFRFSPCARGAIDAQRRLEGRLGYVRQRSVPASSRRDARLFTRRRHVSRPTVRS